MAPPARTMGQPGVAYYDGFMDARTATAGGGGLGAIVEFALRKPGQTLAIVLGAHFLVWTLLPLLTSPNLELDLAENLALGKEWQLGYWKHPPLPWWIADLGYRLTGAAESVYALGPLAVIACFIAVYLLARDIAGPVQALIATLSLVGIHYYNYSAVKFAHDQMQLPFWALTALFFYRGLARGRALDWMLAGAMLALAFWSKYAAFALAISLGLFLLIDPVARQALRTSGPWLMAAAFLVVIAPNAWWLFDSGFLPLQYVGDRAKIPERAIQYVTYPLTWMASQVFFMHPMLILLGITLFPAHRGCAAGNAAILLRAPLRHHAGIHAVRGRHGRRNCNRALADRDVGLSAMVAAAACRPAVVRSGHRSAADVRFHRRRDLPVLPGARDLDRNLARRSAFAANVRKPATFPAGRLPNR